MENLEILENYERIVGLIAIIIRFIGLQESIP